MAYKYTFKDYKTDFTDFRPFSSIDDGRFNSNRYYHSKRSVSPPEKHFEYDEKSRFYKNYDIAKTDSDIRRYSDRSFNPDLGIKSEIYDLQSKLSSKDAKISELERNLRASEDVDSQQNRTLKHLQNRMEILERENRDMSGNHSKAELTISTLETDNLQLKEQIHHLEDRLRRQMEEKELVVQSVTSSERNYEDLKNFLCKTLFEDSFIDTRNHDILMRKLRDFVNENSAMRSRMNKLQDSLQSSEIEKSRNKETIRKLHDDLERSNFYINNAEKIKQDRDTALTHQHQLKEDLQRTELRLMEEKKSSERIRLELREQQMRLSEADAVLNKNELAKYATESEYRAFKETLATILSEGYTMLSPTEDMIKDKVKSLMNNKQDVEKVTKHLEDKLFEVSRQLEEQAELHKGAIQRARKAETEADLFKVQLKGAEGELAATDILKDGLKGEKYKYMELLKQMAELMKMERIIGELGIELDGDALLLRTQQLVQMEEQAMGKKTIESIGFQKQLKEAKKVADSKDVEISYLRKQLNEYEYKAEADWEDVMEKNKKLMKQVEKQNRQIMEGKQTIQSIRAEAVENKALKIANEEMRRQMKEMEKKIAELEDIRSKQSRKIAGLKHDKEQTEIDASHGLQVSESTLQSLSKEVQKLKKLLEDAQKREKQLLDLRIVIARMLGLDVNRLAVPDYEIISRLEKMVETQHEMALDYTRNGFQNPSYRVNGSALPGYSFD